MQSTEIAATVTKKTPTSETDEIKPEGLLSCLACRLVLGSYKVQAVRLMLAASSSSSTPRQHCISDACFI